MSSPAKKPRTPHVRVPTPLRSVIQQHLHQMGYKGKCNTPDGEGYWFDTAIITGAVILRHELLSREAITKEHFELLNKLADRWGFA